MVREASFFTNPGRPSFSWEMPCKKHVAETFKRHEDDMLHSTQCIIPARNIKQTTPRILNTPNIIQDNFIYRLMGVLNIRGVGGGLIFRGGDYSFKAVVASFLTFNRP